MQPERRLIQRLAALSEPRQRVAVLSEEAERLGPEPFVDTLASIVSWAGSSQSQNARVALASLIDYLASDLVSDELKLEFLTAARAGGHSELLDLMVTPSPHRAEEDRHVPDYGAGRLLTLGERKSLARRPSRKVLEKVIADPHPDVIHNLLRNPRLTEADVLRLVTKRPNRDAVLAEVYKSPRWISRYGIKVALVRNPYTPPEISLKLLPLLLRQSLREISGDKELHPSVLLACRRLLRGERDEPADEPSEGNDPGPTIH